MNNRFLRIFPVMAAAFLLAACTQDELADGIGTSLPEGKYPLQIGSVSITADVDQQPWNAGAPQTRVSENDDRGSSRWDYWDEIGVQIEGSTKSGIYYLYGDYKWYSITPVYWENTQAHKVRAWFPADGNVALDNQTTRLAYALYAETAEAVDYTTGEIPLSFGHKLAKVRVKLEGEKAADAESVEIRTYTSCTLNSDGTLTAGDTEDFIPMVETTHDNARCWEANVMPGHIIKEFRLNGNKGTLSDDGFSPVAGMISTINIKVSKSPIPEDAQEITGEISDNGNYLVKGNYTKRITITGGSPNIYLKDANINVEDIRNDNAIHITGGSPTIYVLGENNVSVLYGAGIFVAEGHTVTIVGYKREDKLTARGGNGGSGIGASLSANAGNIHISNVTVEAHGSEHDGLSAGIGGALMYSCGTITIENATVHAYGTLRSDIITPGIGSGYPYSGNPPSIPVVTISNSEIHTHRSSNGIGGNADYIGWGSDNYFPNNTPANSTINLGRGTCKSSTVHCYTGDTLDKTVTYDANGNEMVQYP